jgi:S1-C subfamily serine protease
VSSRRGSLQNKAPREGFAESAREIPELGIEVCNGTGKLTSGLSLRGPVVMRVTPDGPAGHAGFRNQENTTKSVLAGVLIAGALIFPPALVGAAVVADSNLRESHDTIIAVDSQRTRDVQELEDAIDRGREGPILYFSVIRGGRRSQIQVFVHVRNDQTE